MRASSRCLQSLDRQISRRHTVGFVGLGQMGYPMAQNWVTNRVAEHTDASVESAFVICDIDSIRTASFASLLNEKYPRANISVVASPAEVATVAETFLTMLPSTPYVEDAYLGSGGIYTALATLPSDAASATLCIDSTTLDINAAKKVANKIKSLGASMVDAPVSGGVAGAKAGTLSFLVGGESDEYNRASLILAAMGGRIIHCGSSGAGLAAKICNNLVLGVQQIVVGEAMLLGAKLGLDPAILAGVINSSTGGCWASSVNNPVPGALPGKAPPCERDYDGGFLTRLMLKDMRLATDIASSYSSPLPLGGAAKQIYTDVVDKHQDLAGKDFSSVYRYLERAADGGVKIPVD